MPRWSSIAAEDLHAARARVARTGTASQGVDGIRKAHHAEPVAWRWHRRKARPGVSRWIVRLVLPERARCLAAEDVDAPGENRGANAAAARRQRRRRRPGIGQRI